MEMLRPNDKRAKLAIIAISIVTLIAIANIISKYLLIGLINTIMEGDIYTQSSLENHDAIERILWISFLISYIFSIIVFISWFRRAYYNLEQKEPFLSFNNATAAWCWFVPIFNLYKPFQMMREMFTKTNTLLENNHVEPRKSLGTSIVGWWWAFWIIVNVASQIDYRASLHLDNIDAILFSTQVGLVSNILKLPLGIVAIWLILKYSANEELLTQVPDKEEYSVAKAYVPENENSSEEVIDIE